LDGVVLGQGTALANGVWQFDGTLPALADGAYTVQASTVDAAGNAASATRSFSVDRTLPTIAIMQAGDNGTFAAAGSAVVAGTSDAIFRSGAQLLDGVPVGQATVQANGTWQASLPVDRLAGSVTLTASDTDAALIDRRFLRASEGSNGERGAPVFIPGVQFRVVDFPGFDATGSQVAFSAFFYNLGPDPEPDDFTGPYLGKTYIKNLATGELVPVAAGAPDGSLLATLSPNAGHVAFATRARLLASDTNGGPFDTADVTDGIDIYLKNLATGAITLVSAAPDGSASGKSATTFLFVGFADPRGSLAVAEGGRVVAWLRETEIPIGNGLVNRASELVVRDVVAGTSTVLVPPDQAVPSLAQRIALSRDDDVVAWQATVNYSAQFNAPLPGPPVYEAIYGGNWRTGWVTLLSSNADGTPISTGSAPGGFGTPIVSHDGTKVAFQSGATLWVKDIATGALTQAATGTRSAEDPLAGAIFSAFLPDGRILFNSGADIAGVADGPGIDLFAVDPASGAITLVSSGVVAGGVLAASADGRLLGVLTTEALEADDTNGEYDLYVTPLATAAISITAADGSAGALTVAGTAGAIGATVALFVDGLAAGSTVVAANGTWATTLSGIGVGAHQLRATITDALGFSSSDGATVTPGAGGTVIGVVEDGYIAGATVFADADGDGVQDPGEAFTDGAGGFVLAAGGVALASTGGTDIATGLAQPFTWTAPAGFTSVTALSTLIEAARKASGAPLADVLADFAALMPAAPLLQQGDMLAAARAGDAAAQAQLLVVTAVTTQLAAGAAALSALQGGPPGAAFAALAAAVATTVTASAGPPDIEALGAIVAENVARLAPAGSDPALEATLAGILANLVAALPTPGGDPVAFLAGLAAVARVGQADLAGQLAALPGSVGSLDALRARFSRAALDAAIAAAELGDLDGPGVANAPSARADSYALARGRTTTVEAAAGPGANDTDADGDALAFSLLAAPDHGSVVLNADGSFTCTAAENFVGQASFTYRATNAGGLFADATVTLTVEERAETLAGTGTDDRIFGYGLDDIIDGSAGHDRIFAGSGDDTVDAGDGHDRVLGEDGEDAILGGDGNDIIRSGAGNDVLDGGDGNDQLVGEAGDDVINGGTGNDRMNGDAGMDRIAGGAGLDFLNGGADTDTFVLARAQADRDWISGFVSGEDLLEIDAALVGGGLAAGALDPLLLMVGSAPTATQPGVGTFLYDTDDGRLRWDADGSGPGWALVIATLTGAPSLGAGDFVIV
jgi:hypothetical protein